MQLEAQPKVYQQIETSSVLQQTAYWAEVKQEQGYNTQAFDVKIKSKDDIEDCPYINNGQYFDDVLVVLQPLNAQYQMAYVPYGPLVEPQEDVRGQYLEELSENLRPYLPSNCILIRFDLLWESPWAHDDDRFKTKDFWMGPPESHIQEMRMNFNTHEWNLRKAPTDNLPAHTMFLDLTKSKEALLNSMKPKTRYNIRLANRRGVEVSEVTHKNLDIWFDLYKQTAKRNGIHLNNHWIHDFKSVVDAKAEGTKSPADVHLLLAQKEGKALAAMFLTVSQKRATYLYGASSLEQRNSMATYALQWEAINRAKKWGALNMTFLVFRQIPIHRIPCTDYIVLKKALGAIYSTVWVAGIIR